MNQKHLLRFIKKKVKKHGDDVVEMKNGIPVTLSQVIEVLIIVIVYLFICNSFLYLIICYCDNINIIIH